MARQGRNPTRLAVWGAVIILMASVFALTAKSVSAQPPNLPQGLVPGQGAEMTPSGDPASDDGVEVLTRGPLHEAFAEPFEDNPSAGMIVPKEPPAPIDEIPPEYRPDEAGIVWIPGYWGWDDERQDFLWISGIWRKPPPGQQWVPGYWSPVEGGFQWVTGFWAPLDQQEVNYLPAPPQAVYAPPSSNPPGAGYFWVPGCWVYNTGNYQWRAGYWAPGYSQWLWIPSRYYWTPRGYIYRAGYWDYPFGVRGTIFAPVYFNRPYYAGYRYSPTVVIGGGSLLLHLFVNPGYHHYCFGNYYGSAYAQRNIHPWINWYGGNNRYDPIFSYYQWRARTGSNDLARLTGWHNYFNNNPQYRPPQTFQQQIQLGQNRGNLPAQAASSILLASSLRDLAGNSSSGKFLHLGQDQRNSLSQITQPLRDLSRQRHDLETKLSAGAGLGLGTKTGPSAGTNVQGSAPAHGHSSFRLPDVTQGPFRAAKPILGLGDGRGPGTNSANNPSNNNSPRPSLPIPGGRSPDFNPPGGNSPSQPGESGPKLPFKSPLGNNSAPRLNINPPKFNPPSGSQPRIEIPGRGSQPSQPGGSGPKLPSKSPLGSNSATNPPSVFSRSGATAPQQPAKIQSPSFPQRSIFGNQPSPGGAAFPSHRSDVSPKFTLPNSVTAPRIAPSPSIRTHTEPSRSLSSSGSRPQMFSGSSPGSSSHSGSSAIGRSSSPAPRHFSAPSGPSMGSRPSVGSQQGNSHRGDSHHGSSHDGNSGAAHSHGKR